MSDTPNIDAMLARMQDACAGKTLAEQIAYCYDLPLGQARGIAAMIAAERERCAKLIESQFTEARDTEFDLGFETARKVFAAAVRNRQ